MTQPCPLIAEADTSQLSQIADLRAQNGTAARARNVHSPKLLPMPPYSPPSATLPPPANLAASPAMARADPPSRRRGEHPRMAARRPAAQRRRGGERQGARRHDRGGVVARKIIVAVESDVRRERDARGPGQGIAQLDTAGGAAGREIAVALKGAERVSIGVLMLPERIDFCPPLDVEPLGLVSAGPA